MTQEQATLDAVVAQRNEESNKVAQLTGQLVVTLQDVEGLNKIIEEQKAKISILLGHEVEIASLKVTIEDLEKDGDILSTLAGSRLNEITELQGKLEDLRVTPIIPPESTGEITELKDQLGGLEKCNKDMFSKINYLNGLHSEQAKTIRTKNSVISGLEVRLQRQIDNRPPQLPPR